MFVDLRTRNPGIINSYIHEDWKDLARWRWSNLRKDGFMAAPTRTGIGSISGFDGARADALHFAYKFGNGQLARAATSLVMSSWRRWQVSAARGAFPRSPRPFEGQGRGRQAPGIRHGRRRLEEGQLTRRPAQLPTPRPLLRGPARVLPPARAPSSSPTRSATSGATRSPRRR